MCTLRQKEVFILAAQHHVPSQGRAVSPKKLLLMVNHHLLNNSSTCNKLHHCREKGALYQSVLVILTPLGHHKLMLAGLQTGCGEKSKAKRKSLISAFSHQRRRSLGG